MRFSDEDMFCEAQDITTTAVSEHVIDTRRVGVTTNALELPILIQVVEDLASGTSVQVELQSDTTEDFTSGAVKTLKITGVILTASLVAGYQFSIGTLPTLFDRYLRLRFVIDGVFDAGQITAGFVTARQTNA